MSSTASQNHVETLGRTVQTTNSSVWAVLGVGGENHVRQTPMVLAQAGGAQGQPGHAADLKRFSMFPTTAAFVLCGAGAYRLVAAS